MDPDLFFALNDLGAYPEEIQAVKDGLVSGENLLAYLEADVEGRRTPPSLPATEPIPVAPPPPQQVLADPILPQIEAPQLPVVQDLPTLTPVNLPTLPVVEDPVIDVTPDMVQTIDGPVNQVIPDFQYNQLQDVAPFTIPEVTMSNFLPGAGTAVGWLAGAAMQRALGSITSTATPSFTPAGPTREQLGASSYRRKRRRRRRLLTCSDKADIAYLVGQLGQGQLGKAAISALLSRRCG